MQVSWLHRTALLWALLLLVACAQQAPRPSRPRHTPWTATEDSAPPIPIDLDKIPEPVPRIEPRSRYGNHSPYEVFGERYYVLPDTDGYVARGTASWYGTKFHGKLTSNREPYDMYAFSAAHKTLPLPTYARVTNLDNGRSIVVRINDRGPFVGNRLIDLSYVAAVKLGVHIKGTAPVEVRVLDPTDTDAAVLGPLTNTAPPPSTPRFTAAAPATPSVPLNGHAQNLAPATPKPTPIATEPSLAGGLYLQFGAFSAADNARMLRARLHAAGIERIDVRPGVGSSPWRVLAGPFGDRIEALAAQQAATAKGFGGTRIVER